MGSQKSITDKLLMNNDLHYFPTPWLEVVAEDLTLDSIARSFSEELKSYDIGKNDDKNYYYVLQVGRHGISLEEKGNFRNKPLLLDIKWITRRMGQDLLAKSVGKRCSTVIDATAGFGRDTFHFIHLNKQVIAIERSPIIGIMLRDAVSRLLPPSMQQSVELIIGDARNCLLDCDPVDVVYLDPMFPELKTRSALSGIELRLLRSLAGSDFDAPELLSIARSIALQRVVVKRPVRAKPLEGVPDINFKGKTIRYDVYLT